MEILKGSKACGSNTYRYSPGGPPREADTNPYWNYEYPPPSGWYETKTWPQSPYRLMDYIQFMKDYKKKMQEAKDRAIKEAQKAAEKTHGKVTVSNPNNPYALNPGGIMGPKGPFGPDGPFSGGKIGIGPDGDGGFGDRGRYGHDGRFRPRKHDEREIYGPYGVYANYPAAWGAAGIKPANAIRDGVPKDVDEDWPNTWQGLGLPDTGDAPPPMSIGANAYGTFYDCQEKPVRGNCWDRQLRWAYDPYWQNCFEYIYSGCGGSKNMFINYDVCYEMCGPSSRQRICIHTYPFEDYIEWPKENLYTSERAPSGLRNRRMNISNNKTQNVLQKIIINKQPARKMHAIAKIAMNKKQSHHQGEETVYPDKQMMEISTINFLSKTVKRLQNSKYEMSPITENTVSTDWLKNNVVTISNNNAETQISNINNTSLNKHSNVTTANINKTAINNYTVVTNSYHMDIAISHTHINKNPTYNHTNITTSNIIKTSLNNYTDFTFFNIKKNRRYNHTNGTSSHTYGSPVNNHTIVTTSNITKTSIIVSSGITSFNINKNITNNHTGVTASKINKAAVNNHPLITSNYHKLYY